MDLRMFQYVLYIIIFIKTVVIKWAIHKVGSVFGITHYSWLESLKYGFKYANILIFYYTLS